MSLVSFLCFLPYEKDIGHNEKYVIIVIILLYNILGFLTGQEDCGPEGEDRTCGNFCNPSEVQCNNTCCVDCSEELLCCCVSIICFPVPIHL